MKIAEWDNLGRGQVILQRSLGELGANEVASFVSTHESGRQRILVATDIGLLDYTWGPHSREPGAPWYLTGSVLRWHQLQGLRLTTDAASESEEHYQSVWRLIVSEPKIELVIGSSNAVEMLALLAFGRACYAAVG